MPKIRKIAPATRAIVHESGGPETSKLSYSKLLDWLGYCVVGLTCRPWLSRIGPGKASAWICQSCRDAGFKLGQLRKPRADSLDHVASGSWETPVCFAASEGETGRNA